MPFTCLAVSTTVPLLLTTRIGAYVEWLIQVFRCEATTSHDCRLAVGLSCCNTSVLVSTATTLYFLLLNYYYNVGR